MTASDVPTPIFNCTQQGCRSKPFRTRSNLTRHIKSMHGPKATMLCGEERANSSFNNKRHENKCSRCLEIKSQQSRAGVSNGDQHASSDDMSPADPPAESGRATELSAIPDDDSELPDMSTWFNDDSFYPYHNWS
ncbi:hypothetical protein CPLU01_12826 [Colletotrichum plurivorum]|uniref:C2H2-type domain-containing protein n=1 Tax=Colletotrichum plurivorum TaxID=2175906 RepID=A0A8H6JX26_9PEZI|nr:hypothetical protein CPLU01_12826 [Colletotrichum plurivorum]